MTKTLPAKQLGAPVGSVAARFGGGRRPSAPASLSPPSDAAAFSFSSPAEMPPRDAMSDPAPASGGLA